MNLLFRVRNQQIERLESNLVVSGSKNYLHAKFTFTKEWNGLTKTAVFKREEDEEGYLVVLITMSLLSLGKYCRTKVYSMFLYLVEI